MICPACLKVHGIFSKAGTEGVVCLLACVSRFRRDATGSRI